MSILKRKRDLVYFVFFCIHIPVMFFVDFGSLYPDSIRPQLIQAIRDFYIETYHDRFFSHPPVWFTFYLVLELIYHLPLSVWAINALLRDDPRVPIHLFAYAVETIMTTSTCIVDFLSWPDFSPDEKVELAKLYVPYLALSLFMGIDSYLRLVQVARPKKKKA